MTLRRLTTKELLAKLSSKPAKPTIEKPPKTWEVRERFAKSRAVLFGSGTICWYRMRWRNSLALDPCFVRSASKPEEMLLEYIRITKQDPRRLAVDVIRTFPKTVKGGSL